VPERTRRGEEEHERVDPRPRAATPVDPILQAQQTIGNHAVSRILARDAGPQPGPKKPPIGGARVDEIFDTSPYIKELVGEKMKLGARAEKQLRYDDEKAFEEAWIKYSVGKDNPDSRTPEDRAHTEASARLALRRGVRGFHDEERGEIHIRVDRADEGTPLHEGLHLHTHPDFKAFASYGLNEGVTEYFTRKLCQEVGAQRDPNAFLPEHHSVELMVKERDVPDECLAAAYFKGDLDRLRRAMDGDRGMLEQWTGALGARDYKKANDIVRVPKGDFGTTDKIRATA
jgi:hypothetical protein